MSLFRPIFLGSRICGFVTEARTFVVVMKKQPAERRLCAEMEVHLDDEAQRLPAITATAIRNRWCRRPQGLSEAITGVFPNKGKPLGRTRVGMGFDQQRYGQPPRDERRLHSSPGGDGRPGSGQHG